MEHSVTIQTDTSRVLIPREEAARLLNVSVPTMLRWEKQGILRIVRIGRRTYLPVAELDRLASGGER
jgi:excisionase family DNA binding protein